MHSKKTFYTGSFSTSLLKGILLLILISLPNIGLCVENNLTTGSFSFRNKPFSEVIETLSENYNIDIFYSETLAKDSISGEYVDVSLEKLLNRILKGKNISLITHIKENSIYIRTFGEKNQNFFTSSTLHSGKQITNSLDPYTNQTIAQLNSILKQQEINKQARLNDPNYIDPYSGKSQADLNNILKQQDINKRKRLNNPKSTDPMTGLSYVELASIQNQQDEKRTNRLANTNFLDPYTGKSMSELDLILKKQEENKRKRLNDPNHIDPMTGLTMSKLNEIQKKQEENKKIRLGI